MVNLPTGKMKSREGTVVDADDLIAQMIADAKATATEHGQSKDFSDAEKDEIARIVGMGALKYFILKVDARKNMMFNLPSPSTSTAIPDPSSSTPTPAYAVSSARLPTRISFSRRSSPPTRPSTLRRWSSLCS